MITSIRICGFKNLVDLSADFGPMTAIAGLNGVGKSNLFDALMFLKGLAASSFHEAANSIRGGDEDLSNLCSFHNPSNLTFDVDLLIPKSGLDDFGQPASAGATFLNYELKLAIDTEPIPRIRLVSESLQQIRKAEAKRRLKFLHTNDWLNSAVVTSARNAPFISTDENLEYVYRHQDQGSKKGGNKWQFPLKTLTRTILSSAQTAQESPTLLLAKQAFTNLRILHLEPAALRKPDSFHAETSLGSDGSHLPATVQHLAAREPEIVLTRLANRLSTLVAGVNHLRVSRDEVRRTLAVHLEDQEGQVYPASCLSDGTLRFLAMAVLENDERVTGTICLEEPENGIHPEKIDAMVRLLRGFRCDPGFPVDELNPLRQVLFSTHSPTLVKQLQPDELLFAVSSNDVFFHSFYGAKPGLRLLPLAGTWRGKPSVDLGQVISYLEGQGPMPSEQVGTPRVKQWVQEQLNFNGEKH